MFPEEALQRQIELYRSMTGEQRLKIALDLHEFACNVAREGIRRQFPQAIAEEVEQELRRRIELSRSGEMKEDPFDAAYLRHRATELDVAQELDDLLAGRIRPKSS